jgi:hypothetical protein
MPLNAYRNEALAALRHLSVNRTFLVKRHKAPGALLRALAMPARATWVGRTLIYFTELGKLARRVMVD